MTIPRIPFSIIIILDPCSFLSLWPSTSYDPCNRFWKSWNYYDIYRKVRSWISSPYWWLTIMNSRIDNGVSSGPSVGIPSIQTSPKETYRFLIPTLPFSLEQNSIIIKHITNIIWLANTITIIIFASVSTLRNFIIIWTR